MTSAWRRHVTNHPTHLTHHGLLALTRVRRDFSSSPGAAASPRACRSCPFSRFELIASVALSCVFAIFEEIHGLFLAGSFPVGGKASFPPASSANTHPFSHHPRPCTAPSFRHVTRLPAFDAFHPASSSNLPSHCARCLGARFRFLSHGPARAVRRCTQPDKDASEHGIMSLSPASSLHMANVQRALRLPWPQSTGARLRTETYLVLRSRGRPQIGSSECPVTVPPRTGLRSSLLNRRHDFSVLGSLARLYGACNRSLIGQSFHAYFSWRIDKVRFQWSRIGCIK